MKDGPRPRDVVSTIPRSPLRRFTVMRPYRSGSGPLLLRAPFHIPRILDGILRCVRDSEVKPRLRSSACCWNSDESIGRWRGRAALHVFCPLLPLALRLLVPLLRLLEPSVGLGRAAAWHGRARMSARLHGGWRELNLPNVARRQECCVASSRRSAIFKLDARTCFCRLPFSRRKRSRSIQ
jgi:hypothetical protein